MFDQHELASLTELTQAVPMDIIQDAIAHRSGSSSPISPDGQALAKVDGAAEALRNYRQDRQWLAMKWARNFAKRFATEIQSTICGDNAEARAKAVGLTATGVATSLAGWVTGLMGLSGPIALGIAALIVLALGRSLIGTLCDISSAELSTALGG